MNLLNSFKEFPFIAISRGIQPEEALDCAPILNRHGFRIIENPLNSPWPFNSFELLANKFAGEILIGAGTVQPLKRSSRHF